MRQKMIEMQILAKPKTKIEKGLKNSRVSVMIKIKNGRVYYEKESSCISISMYVTC